jgi:predicted nucleotide-binding protein (sugar kinase/HSP70/actin superfamily)
MWRARRELAAVKVDRTRVKPKVAIIGEFWAMTTEGDGNYQLQRFLEGEGAEVDIQLLITWLLYLNWEMRYDTRERANLKGADAGERGLKGVNVTVRQFATWAVDRVARVIFYGWARFMGLKDYKIPDMDELAQISHRFYDNNLRGGEGHMEVGKLMMNVMHNKVNMTISVKPFGCMPSSGVSDGIQSIITEMYPQAIFLPIETSGDGAVNIYSRVQMQLFKARQVARKEFEDALRHYGLSEEELREYIEVHPKFAHALHRSPHRVGCTAADLVHEIGRRMGRGGTKLAAQSA